MTGVLLPLTMILVCNKCQQGSHWLGLFTCLTVREMWTPSVKTTVVYTGYKSRPTPPPTTTHPHIPPPTKKNNNPKQTATNKPTKKKKKKKKRSYTSNKKLQFTFIQIVNNFKWFNLVFLKNISEFYPTPQEQQPTNEPPPKGYISNRITYKFVNNVIVKQLINLVCFKVL